MLTFSVNKDINKLVDWNNLVDFVTPKDLDNDHDPDEPVFLVPTKPTSDYGKAWWSEALEKTLQDKTKEKINLDAYGYACERNTRMAVGSREVALLTVEEIENGLRGVADTVASYLDINIDYVVESSEVKTLVDEFLYMQDFLIAEEGVNLWKVITLARHCNKAMVDKLKDLLKRHPIESLVEGILKNRECLKVLEGVMA